MADLTPLAMVDLTLVASATSGPTVVASAASGPAVVAYWIGVTVGGFLASIFLLTCIAGVCLRRPAAKVQAADIEAAGHKWAAKADGRLIEYTTCGQRDGMAVYWASCYGASATMIPKYAKELALREHLFIISISMPGFGLSDSLPLGYKRSLLEWPEDVDAVLAKEGVDKLFLMGTSTGCVHAAAFANAFPARVLGVLFNTPTAPHSVEKNSKEIATATKMTKWLLGSRYIGDALAGLFSLATPETKWNSAPDIKAAVSRMKSLGGRHGEAVQDVIDDFTRATVHTYRGWCDTMHVIEDDPPFDIGNLSVLTQRGVRFWITTTPDDTTNPPSMQEWWKNGVQGSEMVSFEAGWGHFHGFVPENMDRMFALVKSVVPS